VAAGRSLAAGRLEADRIAHTGAQDGRTERRDDRHAVVHRVHFIREHEGELRLLARSGIDHTHR